MEMNEQTVDSEGTTQRQAKEMLENLYRRGFSGDINELALVLGRDSQEMENILNKNDIIDDDLAMKIRGIAKERNIEIE